MTVDRRDYARELERLACAADEGWRALPTGTVSQAEAAGLYAGLCLAQQVVAGLVRVPRGDEDLWMTCVRAMRSARDRGEWSRSGRRWQ